MCLSFRASGEMDTEQVLPPIQIRKRYNSVRRETTLELVRSRKECKSKTTSWDCECGSRMDMNIRVCSDCGNHSKTSCGPPKTSKKHEKTYKSLRKSICSIEKDLKDIRKDMSGKKTNASKPPKTGCCCVVVSPSDEANNPPCSECKHKDSNEKKHECCGGIPSSASPKPIPIVPQQPCLPFDPLICPGTSYRMTLYPMPSIPMMPGHTSGSLPQKIVNSPDEKPTYHIEASSAVNVILPQYKDIRNRRSCNRDRSPSESSSSTITVQSFERMKHRILGLGRRVYSLEDEAQREERHRRSLWDQQEVDRIRDLEKNKRLRTELVDERRRRDRYLSRGRESCARSRDEYLDEIPRAIRILPFTSRDPHNLHRYRYRSCAM